MTMFKKIWTAWCLLSFIVLASLFYFIEFFLIAFGKSTYRLAHRFPAFSTRVLLRTWGIRVLEHNKSLLQNLPPCVILLNHRCDLDALIATGYMPGIYKFIGKKDLEKYPFIGMLVRMLYITVDRADTNSKQQSLRNMKTQAATGANIVVFPEGWSNFSNEFLLPLQRGAFKVAIDQQMPIVVATLIGTHELFPKPKIEVRPGTAHLFWETKISTVGMNFETHGEKLKEQVREIWLKRLTENYPNGYIYPKDQFNFDEWKQKQLKKII